MDSSALFLCFATGVCSIAYGSGQPWLANDLTQADFSFTGDDDDTKPAPTPNGDAIVERELSGKSMSFSFTGDDSDTVLIGDEAAVTPPASGESIIQRELSSEGKSFGFTD